MKTKLLALATASTLISVAGAWPTGPIKLVVPYTPGGITDELARSVGEPLSADLKVPVIYEYKPGVSGIVGANYVAKSKPDGYTFLLISNSIATASLTTKIPFDPLVDLRPVSLLTLTPAVVVVRKDLPVDTFDDFMRLAKESPYKINYATSGTGSLTHLAMEKAQQEGDFKITHVPYKGQSEIWQDFLGGHLDALIDTPAGITKYISDKKVKVLAFTSKARLDYMPDIQTIAESKIKDFSAYGGFLILSPAGVPDKIVNQLSAKLASITNSPAFKTKFSPKGMISVGSTAKEAMDFLKNEQVTWKLVSDKMH